MRNLLLLLLVLMCLTAWIIVSELTTSDNVSVEDLEQKSSNLKVPQQNAISIDK